MYVARGDGVCVHRRDRVRVRQHHILDRRRRGVAAEHASRPHGRREAAQERKTLVAELGARPMRRLQDALVRLFAAEVERNEDVIRVPVDARAAELLQELHALAWLRSALRDVAERDDQIGLATLLQIGERCPERDSVSVHVGEEGDAHTGTL